MRLWIRLGEKRIKSRKKRTKKRKTANVESNIYVIGSNATPSRKKSLAKIEISRISSRSSVRITIKKVIILPIILNFSRQETSYSLYNFYVSDYI